MWSSFGGKGESSRLCGEGVKAKIIEVEDLLCSCQRWHILCFLF